MSVYAVMRYASDPVGRSDARAAWYDDHAGPLTLLLHPHRPRPRGDVAARGVFSLHPPETTALDCGLELDVLLAVTPWTTVGRVDILGIWGRGGPLRVAGR